MGECCWHHFAVGRYRVKKWFTHGHKMSGRTSERPRETLQSCCKLFHEEMWQLLKMIFNSEDPILAPF